VLFHNFAILCNTATEAEDEVAQMILRQAGGEIVCSIITAARRLNFADGAKIPLVFVGGTFKSRFFYNAVARRVTRCGFNFEIIKPELPALGAIRCALKNLGMKKTT